MEQDDSTDHLDPIEEAAFHLEKQTHVNRINRGTKAIEDSESIERFDLNRYVRRLNGTDQVSEIGDDDSGHPDIDTERDVAISRHAAQGAAERKILVGLSRQEPGSAQVSPTKSVDGLQWRNGKLCDRPWHEHAGFRESVRQQNAFQRAEQALWGERREARCVEGFAERGYDPPDQTAPDVSTPKAATGFAVTAPKRRVSRADKESAAKLLDIGRRIRGAYEAGERTKAGVLLREAQSLIGHGGFQAWVERETGLSASTAERLRAS